MNWKSFKAAKGLRLTLIALLWIALGLAVLWAAAALWFDGPKARWLAGLLAVAFLGSCVAMVVKLRPKNRAMRAVAVAFLLVALWWNLIPARNDRDWYPDVARTARATIEGDQLTIENVRNFDYRTEEDYIEHWETRTYDLSRLQGMDMFLSYWGPTLIAHTIASWDFGDGKHLAISIETRKEKGESYSAVRGFFRQYELYYVVSDERDVIRLRTNYRGEHVYLYRLRTSAEDARKLLLDYLRAVNILSEHAYWYNALTHNCTTMIRYHAKQVAEGRPWDFRILANGKIDELGYERGQIDTTLPFAELRVRSNITQKAKDADQAADFSARIREGLPGAHGKVPPPGSETKNERN